MVNNSIISSKIEILIKLNNWVRSLMIKSFKYFKVLCFKKVIATLKNNNTAKIL